jgi:flagellar protein FlbD
MINLTHLNGEAVVVNAEIIALVESRPDTILTLTSGMRLTVREPISDIIERVVDYRRRVLTPLRGLV